METITIQSVRLRELCLHWKRSVPKWNLNFSLITSLRVLSMWRVGSLYTLSNSITTVCPRHWTSIKLKLLKDEGEVISSSAFNHQMWKSKTYCNSFSCVAVIFVVRTCTRENDQMTLTISLGAFPVSSTHMADVVIF